MTIDELTAECWADLPLIRSRLAGKSTVRHLLADTLAELDVNQLEACRSDEDRDGYKRRLLARVKRRNSMDDRDGFAIMAFLLATIAGAVISWLIQRWLDNRFPKRSEIENLKATLK